MYCTIVSSELPNFTMVVYISNFLNVENLFKLRLTGILLVTAVISGVVTERKTPPLLHEQSQVGWPLGFPRSVSHTFLSPTVCAVLILQMCMWLCEYDPVFICVVCVCMCHARECVSHQHSFLGKSLSGKENYHQIDSKNLSGSLISIYGGRMFPLKCDDRITSNAIISW